MWVHWRRICKSGDDLCQKYLHFLSSKSTAGGSDGFWTLVKARLEFFVVILFKNNFLKCGKMWWERCYFWGSWVATPWRITIRSWKRWWLMVSKFSRKLLPNGDNSWECYTYVPFSGIDLVLISYPIGNSFFLTGKFFMSRH